MRCLFNVVLPLVIEKAYVYYMYMNDRLPTYRLFNGTGHPIDCAGGGRLERDKNFPEAIRASTAVNKLGSVSVKARSVVGEVPLYEMSMTGSLVNMKGFKTRIHAIHEQMRPGERAALAVSPIAAVAIDLLRYDLPDNITVVYPAGMIRDQTNDGKIRNAQRFDTLSRRKNKLATVATRSLHGYREEVMGSATPWSLVSHMPEGVKLVLPSGARMTLGSRESHIIEPDYNSASHIGMTEAPYAIPITEPKLKRIINIGQVVHHELAVIHSRAIPPFLQLPPPNLEDTLAHTVMLHHQDDKRTREGFQDSFDSFLVYSDETIRKLAERLPA